MSYDLFLFLFYILMFLGATAYKGYSRVKFRLLSSLSFHMYVTTVQVFAYL